MLIARAASCPIRSIRAFRVIPELVRRKQENAFCHRSHFAAARIAIRVRKTGSIIDGRLIDSLLLGGAERIEILSVKPAVYAAAGVSRPCRAPSHDGCVQSV